MSNHPGLQDYEASELGGSSEEGSIGDASSRPLRPDELETHLDMHAHWLEDAGREDDPPNNLEGSRLPPNADLRNRNLRGANLAGIVFGDALVSGTDFRDADLQDADMSGVQGLTPRKLAGAMLSRIDLPENVTVSEGCSQATQTARLARTIFLMIIGACIFCLFAIATTSDQDLLAGRADHSLPFVDVTVPVRPFMVYAPLFLLVVYGYFHLYLQALWEELSHLPAIFPDDRPLDAHIDPWMVVSRVHTHVPRLRRNRPNLSRLRESATVLSAWSLVPLTIAGFWFRLLPLREPDLTFVQGILLVIAVTIGWTTYRLSKLTLRGEIMRKHFGKQRLGRAAQSLAFVVVISSVVGGLSMIFWWAPPRHPIVEVPPDIALVGKEPSGGRVRQIVGAYVDRVRRIPEWFDKRRFLKLADAEISSRPDDWFLPEAPEGDGGDLDGWIEEKLRPALRNVSEDAQLQSADLRAASAQNVFLVNAKLDAARLDGAFLLSADLRGAKLENATLDGAYLFNAKLDRAVLSFSQQSRLPNPADNSEMPSEFARINLTLASLIDANLRSADLRGAILYKADLRKAALQGAFLNGAFLDRANLAGADFDRADLRGASLVGSDLRNAIFSDAKLEGAKFDRADLSGADLANADISHEQVADACGDKETKLPDGFDPVRPCSERIGR